MQYMFKLPTLRALKRERRGPLLLPGRTGRQEKERQNGLTNGRGDEPIKAPSFPPCAQTESTGAVDGSSGVAASASSVRPSVVLSARDPALLEHVKLARRAAMAGAASADIADGPWNDS